VLQQAQVGDHQAAPVPARKGKGHSGGSETLPDDLKCSCLFKNRLSQNQSGGQCPARGKMEVNKNVSIVGRTESLEEMPLGGTLPPAEQPEPLLGRHPGGLGGARKNSL